MKNFLIGYTTLVAFIVITMVSAMVLPSNTETSIALDNGTDVYKRQGLVLSTVVAMTGKVKRGKQTRPRTISFTPAEVLQNDLSRADNSTAIKFALGQSGVVQIRPSNTQAIVFNPSNGTVSRTRLYLSLIHI